MYSIRRFLSVSLLLVILGGGLLLGLITYLTLYDELDEQYDAELIQSAHLLASFWREGQLPDQALAALDEQENRYQRYFVYQLWNDHKLVMASAGAPRDPFTPLGSRPHYNEKDGWHIYTLPLSGQRWLVLAESDRSRRSLVDSMAAVVLSPYLLSLPVILILVWLAIRRGLKPLSRLTHAVANRSADNLEPLPSGKPVRELLPLEQAINELLGQLQDALDREKRFTADAAHELRTLLMVLRLHADNARHLTDASQVDASLQQLDTALVRASRMVEQLLALARLDPQVFREQDGECDATALSRDIIANLLPLADARRQQLSLLLEQAMPVAMPAESLHLVLRNLLDNACRYSPAGSEIAVDGESLGNRVRLTISDGGEGLDDSAQKRFRERFSRGDRDQSGAGLGLSIVDRVLSLYGGTLSYRCRQGDLPAAAIVTIPAARGGAAL
ncbi:sensor histidine kinase [Alcanivorax hongdengensis A-11-3]|uniref:histidine kinase n=1 Tax=Alcanivorax hongdengensis A-11-3 TaxID=1177179 RepID=L0WAY9_9GAMM|nr:ATP-binding protein [Alcanivorax hongdengensis]EKF72875.1 sensor histidine kinase [Alcanivorax hongdengensis A-11-3]